jgi:stress-induced morphogen
MYAIEIESPKFKGLTVIKQHKMVNQVLKEEIAQWHVCNCGLEPPKEPLNDDVNAVRLL